MLAVNTAEAQQVSGFVEEWNIVTKDGTTPEVHVYLRGPVKGKLGWTTWTINGETWSEGLGGLAVAPVSWMEIQAVIGLETDDDPLRGGVNLWLGNERVSMLFIQEYGGSGYWYKYIATLDLGKGLLLGAYSDKTVGTGPYLEKKIGKFSAGGVYTLNDKKGVVFGRFSF